MKKTMLWSAVFVLISTQGQADITSQSTQSQTSAPSSAPITNNNQEPVVIQKNPAQPVPGTQQDQFQGVQPNKNMQNPQYTQPAQQIPLTVEPSIGAQPQAQKAPVINCHYKIPETTKNIEQSLVLAWSEKAVIQVFNFDPIDLDTQMQELKNCFTDQGWIGFSSALEKSGNLEAIKTQKLTVSSHLDGQAEVTEIKNNQWKITLPLQVIYQNDKEKVAQLLRVNLTVGRKINGDLGIVQMIATSRPYNPVHQSNSATVPTTPARAPTPSGAAVTPPTNPSPATNTEGMH